MLPCDQAGPTVVERVKETEVRRRVTKMDGVFEKKERKKSMEKLETSIYVTLGSLFCIFTDASFYFAIVSMVALPALLFHSTPSRDFFFFEVKVE